MTRLPGSRRRKRANAAPERTQRVHSHQPLRLALASLEQCREILLANASEETARLVSMAILQLRMDLNGISDAELKALCDALLRDREQDTQGPTTRQRSRRRSSILHS